jgi:hypothetical protein
MARARRGQLLFERRLRVEHHLNQRHRNVTWTGHRLESGVWVGAAHRPIADVEMVVPGVEE